METKDMIVYGALGLLFIIGLLNLILTISIFKRTKTVKAAANQPNKVPGTPAAGAGVVFCKNCGRQYNSAEPACPNCKTPR